MRFPLHVEMTGAASARADSGHGHGRYARWTTRLATCNFQCQRVGADASARTPTIRHRRHGRSDSRAHSPGLPIPSPLAAAVLGLVPLARGVSSARAVLASATASDDIDPKRPRLVGVREFGRGGAGSADKLLNAPCAGPGTEEACRGMRTWKCDLG